MKCPKCQSDMHIIAEPPGWLHDDPHDPDWKVQIECFCTKCKVAFETIHNIGEALETTIVEEDYKYPYSA